MGGDKRASEGEMQKGIVGEMEGLDESKREGGSSVTEQGKEEAKEAEQETAVRLNQVGKKGREEARAKSGGGDSRKEEEAVAEIELETMGSVKSPVITQREKLFE